MNDSYRSVPDASDSAVEESSSLQHRGHVSWVGEIHSRNRLWQGEVWAGKIRSWRIVDLVDTELGLAQHRETTGYKRVKIYLFSQFIILIVTDMKGNLVDGGL